MPNFVEICLSYIFSKKKRGSNIPSSCALRFESYIICSRISGKG